MLVFLSSIAVGMVVYMTLWYWFAMKQNNLGVIDIAYATAFVVIAMGVILFTPSSFIKYIISGLVIVWGLRLSIHIALRNTAKKEDWRYSEFRKKWTKNFPIKAYTRIFLLQGMLILIISAPLIIISGSKSAQFGVLAAIGLALWIVGFVIELIADKQLANFIANKKSAENRFMQNGLWRYSRHPNYFGEVMLWWGLWLMVTIFPYGLWAVVSPLLITFLILFVSGVPILERKYKNDPKFIEYSNKTSKFIILPPKKRE